MDGYYTVCWMYASAIYHCIGGLLIDYKLCTVLGVTRYKSNALRNNITFVVTK